MQDYLANAQHGMSQPIPSMSVYASYDEFAQAKHAELQKLAAPFQRMPPPPDTFSQVHQNLSTAFGQALAKKLVSDPIDDFHRILKKKIVDDPKAHDTFHHVVSNDEILGDAYKQDPKSLEEAFGAMRKFAPSMVTTPAAVRSFLRQSTMGGGNLDFATLRLMAETEKFIQTSRGKVPGQ